MKTVILILVMVVIYQNWYQNIILANIDRKLSESIVINIAGLENFYLPLEGE